MNKLSCGLILITFAVFLCFVSFQSTKTIAESSIEYLENIEHLVQNNQSCEEQMEKFDEFWNNKSKILQILIHHEQVEDIEYEVAKLKLSITKKNNFETLKICSCLKSRLENLKKINEISLENIL